VRTRRNRQKPEKRRREILDAALQVAGDLGLDGITSRDVASVLGVAPGLVHRYFGAVDGVVAHAFAHCAHGHARPRRLRQDNDRDDPRDGFAREVADRVVFFDAGVVVESGPAEEVTSRLQHERTRASSRQTVDHRFLDAGRPPSCERRSLGEVSACCCGGTPRADRGTRLWCLSPGPPDRRLGRRRVHLPGPPP